MSTASGEDGAFGGVHASSKERRSALHAGSVWKLTPSNEWREGAPRETPPAAVAAVVRTGRPPIPSRCWKARPTPAPTGPHPLRP